MSTLTVIVTSNVNETLRGALTRWLIEVKPGVYVGRLTSKVTDYIWEEVRLHVDNGSSIKIRQTHTDQGYNVESTGTGQISLEDFNGLVLPVRVQHLNKITNE